MLCGRAGACAPTRHEARPLLRDQVEVTPPVETTTSTSTTEVPSTTTTAPPPAPETFMPAASPKPARTTPTTPPTTAPTPQATWAPVTTPPTSPPTTTAPAPWTPAPAPASAPAPAQVPVDALTPYRGLGTWASLYTWSRTVTNSNNPPVGSAAIDRMAALGVQTLFIQTAFADSQDAVVDQDLLVDLINRAHARGMRAVVWYLPTLVDTNRDMWHLMAAAALPADGLAVDVEARNVQDVNDRNQRLVGLSSALRQSLPGRVLGAIVVAPVVMDVINPNFWPGFPWEQLAPYYDIWLPMSYWTGRTTASGYKDGYRYTFDDIRLLRDHVKQPSAPVHTIGGTSDQVLGGDVDGMVRAAAEQGALGGSLYDYNKTTDDIWPHLLPLRA